MSIEQNIADGILISKDTGIPFLFMSNPGLGKTTILKRFALNHDMHLETLIGSRFTPEEISGYQVNNGGDHLTHINPEWYSRIIENDTGGKASILFIDELSTCSESVQGALLSLIFDRAINNQKKLPDSCIIVSAANYASNLPPMMNIMAPTLNRFVIVNLNDEYNAMDMIEEFLNPLQEISCYTRHELTQKDKDDFMSRYKDAWKEIFIKYSDKESSVGILDISNPALDGLYTESAGCVYNFISGRTLYYLAQVLLSYRQLGINNKDLLKKMINGLVGMGTCSFKEKKQLINYQSFVNTRMSKLLVNKKTTQSTEFKLSGNISSDVQSYLFNRENMSFTSQDDLKAITAITSEVTDKFKGKNIVQKCQNEVEIASFISDLDAITELYQYAGNVVGSDSVCSALLSVSMNYYMLYCQILGFEADYKQKFGTTNPLFEGVVFVKRRNSQNKIVLSRGALRFLPGSSIPSFYLIDKEHSYLDAKLAEPISRDSILGIVSYENKVFKFISLDAFIKKLKG